MENDPSPRMRFLIVVDIIDNLSEFIFYLSTLRTDDPELLDLYLFP